MGRAGGMGRGSGEKFSFYDNKRRFRYQLPIVPSIEKVKKQFTNREGRMRKDEEG